MWDDLRRFPGLPLARKFLLCEALASLAAARIAMACVPFRRIAAWMGTPGAESPAGATPEETRTAEAVGWAVGAMGGRVPWDGRCLAQALAASSMLRRRGVEGTVSFGVREGESAEFDAHAWLRVGALIVTGGPAHQGFKTITTFARRRS
jgi:transglutaminase-like putative cysteine protease